VSAATFVLIVLGSLPLEAILFAVLCAPYVQIGRRYFRHQGTYWIVGGVLLTLIAIVPAIFVAYLIYAPRANK
jgi:hypothetical protein